MFRLMDSEEREMHQGASNGAIITANSEFPVVMVIDGDRIEIYWTDEGSTPVYAKDSSHAKVTCEAIKAAIDSWLWRGLDRECVYHYLAELLPEFGFARIADLML